MFGRLPQSQGRAQTERRNSGMCRKSIDLLTPVAACTIQQKQGTMFVSSQCLIFRRYIFRLNWNLSGRIGGEWHQGSSWIVSLWLTRCNKTLARAKRCAPCPMKSNSESMGVKGTLLKLWCEWSRREEIAEDKYCWLFMAPGCSFVISIKPR